MLTPEDRDHLVSNLAGALSDGVEHEVQVRSVEHWSQVDAGLGSRLATQLGLASSNGPAAPAAVPAAVPAGA